MKMWESYSNAQGDITFTQVAGLFLSFSATPIVKNHLWHMIFRTDQVHIIRSYILLRLEAKNDEDSLGRSYFPSNTRRDVALPGRSTGSPDFCCII